MNCLYKEFGYVLKIILLNDLGFICITILKLLLIANRDNVLILDIHMEAS